MNGRIDTSKESIHNRTIQALEMHGVCLNVASHARGGYLVIPRFSRAFVRR